MNQEEATEQADERWAKLAKRLTTAILARREVSYHDLTLRLQDAESHGGERAIKAKILRGTLKLSLLLEILATSGIAPPQTWATTLESRKSWEEKASRVCATELTQAFITSDEDIEARLTNINCNRTSRTLRTHIADGTISVSAFLQILFALNSRSLERYIELEDMRWAALGGTAP